LQSGLTADGGPLAGADVTAVDSSGNALSAPASVQTDGGFSLYLPPGTTGGYFLQVSPAFAPDGGLAAAALDPLPNYDGLTPASALDLPLPPVAVLQGTVKDTAAAPIAGARVYARSDGMPWSLSRSTVTAADGTWSMPLRAGNYVVEAAPSAAPDAPGVSGEILASLPVAGASLDIVCPGKVHGFGLVIRPEGGAVSANFQITATRIADRLITARSATTTTTDSGGLWHIIADPGRYRVEVVPTADSGYPRKLVQIQLDPPTSSVEVTLPQIPLSPPLVVGGVVGAAPDPTKAGAAAANATVTFYGLDATGHGVLLGAASTDDKGQYKAVLPDVAQPGTSLGY
jgi:carboxypeptidase family protein